MKRALCIWLPNWPIQRLVRAQPELKKRPVVLYETWRGVQRVLTCSHQSTAAGVRAGMPVSEVKAMQQAGNGTQLGILSHDPDADREALESLAGRCGRFSPLVGLDPSPAADSLLLDVTGLAHLFGGEVSLAEKIVNYFRCLGLLVQVAIADTVAAAWAVARYGKRGSGGVGEEGRQAVDTCSVFVVPSNETITALRPLPVAALRLSDEVVDLLRQLGVDRVGQLEALPRSEFLSRFGPELLQRWDQATGRLVEPVPAHGPPPQLRADWSPEHPTTRRATIEAALAQLVDRLAGLLEACGRGAVRLECRFDCRSIEEKKLPPVIISVGLFEPTASSKHLTGLAQTQLERLRLPGPVTAVEVAATATAKLVHRQQELFPDGGVWRQAAARQLGGLVDRLSGRLGRRSVLRVRLVPDAQPELSWHGDPMVASRTRRRGRVEAKTIPPRPLRLLRRPIALRATSVAPDGPPLRFQMGTREHRIARTWGPERIETGWWRGRSIGRDYYRIETTAGRRFWLFRRLRDRRWFVHGMFE